MLTYRGDVLTKRARAVLATAVVGLLFGNLVALRAADAPDGGSGPGGGSALPTHEAEPAVSDEPTGGLGGAAPSSTTPTAPPAGGPRATAQPSTTTTLPPMPEDFSPPSTFPSGYEFEMTLEPTCVKVGQMIKVTARLKYLGGIAMRATYADGDAHDSGHAATAWDQSGVVTHEWPAPDAPGDATLYAQAHDPENKRNGTKTIPFKVVKATSSC